MIEIEVKGLTEFMEKLKGLGADRIPQHAARALNALGEDAKRAMLQDAKQNLTLRGNWFNTGTRFGFNRFSAATKSNLEVKVGSRAPWIFQQETEMFKTAHKSFLIVPMPAVRAGRGDTKKIRRSLLPAQMGAKLIKIETKKGPILFQRLKRAGLRALWALEKAIRYPRRVHLVDAATKAVNANADRAMSDQVDAAIREQGLK